MSNLTRLVNKLEIANSGLVLKVLYVMPMKCDSERGQARISSVAYFKLTSPLLSIAMIGAKHCKFKNHLSSKENTEPDEEREVEFKSDDDSQEKGSFFTVYYVKCDRSNVNVQLFI